MLWLSSREYLLEVKVRLLEQLSCGFNSPQLAIEFIQMLLDEYTTLCNALPSLLFLLEQLVSGHVCVCPIITKLVVSFRHMWTFPLILFFPPCFTPHHTQEECEYIQKLGVTIELMNKNIFRELIFAESFMSSNLPLIIAQLRWGNVPSSFPPFLPFLSFPSFPPPSLSPSLSSFLHLPPPSLPPLSPPPLSPLSSFPLSPFLHCLLSPVLPSSIPPFLSSLPDLQAWPQTLITETLLMPLVKGEYD